MSNIWTPKPLLGELPHWTPLRQGLVGEWWLNEGAGTSAFDLSGRGNNLTISGATWISDALRFVAVETDYAQVNKCPFITYPFSLCCRFRPTGTSDGVLIWVGDKDSTGDYSELTARGNVLNVRAFTATTGGGGADSGATGTTDYVLNAWHTAAAVFESQSLRKVYLDGALDATDTTTVGTSNAYDRMGIGARLDASPSAFSDCDISHVAIYNRVLTAGEVQQLDINPKRALGYTREEEIIRMGSYVAAGGTDYTRVVDDSLGLTDSVSRMAAFTRSQADNLGLTDAESKVSAFDRTQNEALGLTDAFDRQADFDRMQDDSLGLSDAAGRVVDFARSVDDSLGLSDALTRVADYARTQNETLGLSDSISRVADYIRTQNDNEGITDLTRKYASGDINLSAVIVTLHNAAGN